DRGPHVHARLHRDGREAVRQDVDEDDAEPAGADGARRLDERLGLDRERLALYEPHVARPPDERERHDRVHDPGAERPPNGERRCLVHRAAAASRVRGSSQLYARSTRKFASMKLRPSRSVTPMIGWKSLDTAELTA